MSIASDSTADAQLTVSQYVTFTVGKTILAVNIGDVQEINRSSAVTKVPGASEMIHGVVNLRGDVVTVLNPHEILGMEPTNPIHLQKNLIVSLDGERFGVLVDDVAEILSLTDRDLSQRPTNVRSIDRRFIESVYVGESDVVVILNAQQLLGVVLESSTELTA